MADAAVERSSEIQAIINDCLERRHKGESLPDARVIANHPDLMPELAVELEKLALVQEAHHRAQGAGDSDAANRGDESDTSGNEQHLIDAARRPVRSPAADAGKPIESQDALGTDEASMEVAGAERRVHQDDPTRASPVPELPPRAVLPESRAGDQSPGKLHRGGGGFRPDQRIQQWTLVRYVAAGAFGHVWLAQRERHKRLYVIKLVAASEAAHERAGVGRWKVVDRRGTAPGLMPIVEDGDVDGWGRIGQHQPMPARRTEKNPNFRVSNPAGLRLCG